MINIVQINVDANNGSNGGIARDIGKLIRQEGWTSTIIYGRKHVPDESTLIKVGSNIDVIFHLLESRLFDNHGLSSRTVTKKLVSKLQSIKPDIIHLHNIHGYYINFRILFNYINTNKIPVIWTLHDCWTFTGHCAFFNIINCDKWKTKCHNCKLRSGYPTSWLLDKSQRNFNLKKELFTATDNMVLVPVANWLHNYLKESFFKDKNIETIHNGIDLNVFRPLSIKKNTLGVNSDKFVILGVANGWIARKGLQEFIKLSKNPNYQIILIGTNKETDKIIPPNIISIHKTENQNELSKYYSIADVFVNPTYADTFPTVNLEALACGTPVITYRTGGSPEAIDEHTGYVVECGDFENLRMAIESIRNKTQEDKIVMQKLCRKRAENYFNKDICFNKYISLYKRILESCSTENF